MVIGHTNRPSYFEDEPNGCPCLACKPANADSIENSSMVTRQPLDVNERRSANKSKRSRQVENKRKLFELNDIFGTYVTSIIAEK